jgi:Ca2+-binding EF-hand superfamily protein
VNEFKKTVESMEEKDKSLLILKLVEDMEALGNDEIDYDTFQSLVTTESVFAFFYFSYFVE